MERLASESSLLERRTGRGIKYIPGNYTESFMMNLLFHAPITVERVTPAAVKGQDVEQQAEKENM